MFTRRELTLLLFCLTVYILSYNLDASADLLRSSASYISAASLAGVANVLRPDGRRLNKYVDDLEREIVGDWEDDGPRPYNLGIHGATTRQAKVLWPGDSPLPVTKMLAHVPGFTILDNVYIANATIFFVTDDPESLPPRDMMLSSAVDYTQGPRVHDLQYISTVDAKERVGGWAARMNGVSWLSYGPSILQDAHTLFALYRAHSTLLYAPTPDRMILAHTEAIQLNLTGVDARITRALFPAMGFLFYEEWDDFHGTNKPFLFDRLVLADRGAAIRGAASFDYAALAQPPAKASAQLTLSPVDTHLPFAAPFALPAPANWWAPARARLLAYLSIADDAKSKALTYVSTQHRATGPRLRAADHAKLVAELRKLGAAQGWAVHVVEHGGADQTPWSTHLLAAARSSVMLGVHGDALTQSIFMKSPATATVMEFFPDGAYWPAREFIARSLGMDYIAWWSDRKFTRDSLPQIASASAAGNEISVDVGAVVKAVREQMRRA